MASVLLLKQSKTSDKQGGAALSSIRVCVCVCVVTGGVLSLASAQCVQQLQLSASVYTVGAILLSERLIGTKSRMVMEMNQRRALVVCFKHTCSLSAACNLTSV